MDVGARLQAIRKLKGLSQRELAKRAGVTNSTISMIEKNSVSPSISSLKKVLSGIPMPLVEFFSLDLEQSSDIPVVYRAGELSELSKGSIVSKLVGKDYPNRSLSLLDESFPPGADTGNELSSHEGETSGLLVEGRLELTVGEEIFLLEAGDSYYFDSNRPHRIRNPFDAPARLISATTPATF